MSDQDKAALAQQAVPEPVGIVTALNVCGEPMPNSSGVEWLRPVPLGAKLYAAAPQAPQAEQQAGRRNRKEDRLIYSVLLSGWQKGEPLTQIAERVADALAAKQAEREPSKCAQCKKAYKPGSTTSGCPKCAPDLSVSEEEFCKPLQTECDAGELCIGCSPRNADGSCPDAALKTCRADGRCQYAIDSGAEGTASCVPGKCVMAPKNVALTINIDTSPIAAEIAELQSQLNSLGADKLLTEIDAWLKSQGQVGAMPYHLLLVKARSLLRAIVQTPAASQADHEQFSEDQWWYQELDAIAQAPDQRRAMAVIRKMLRVLVEREPLTRKQAIAIARQAAVAARDESGNPAHSYLPMDSGENWEPHEWVVDAIMAAAGQQAGKGDA